MKNELTVSLMGHVHAFASAWTPSNADKAKDKLEVAIGQAFSDKDAEIAALKAELIALRESGDAIQTIADWLDSSVEYQQDSYDEPPSPRNEFDYALYQAGSELSAIARSIKGTSQAMQSTNEGTKCKKT